jgi:hypothetical protein
MTQRLICRLSGHRTVLRQIPSGVGPLLWMGGFETDQGEPYASRLPNHEVVHEVRSAATLGKLLDVLAGLAPDAYHAPMASRRKRSRRSKRVSEGHSEGTDPVARSQTAL